MTTTENARMALFAQSRLQDELVAIATAHCDFQDEAAHMGIAAALYASYQRRRQEDAVAHHIIDEMVLIEEERVKADQADPRHALPYSLPHLRAMLCRWPEHPDFESAWAAPQQRERA